MNYLAHLLLADDTAPSRIGNLLGDFTRGSLEKLGEIYPPELIRGISMHRDIDRFTDSHPTFRVGRSLLHPSRSRFAGIVLDIYYDHFLSRHWEKFSSVDLMSFTQQVYKEIEAHPQWQAGRLADIFPSMMATNWLAGYGSIEGIEHTLVRMSQRSPRIGAIAGSVDDLKAHYADFEQLFLSFMPELVSFTEGWKQAHPLQL